MQLFWPAGFQMNYDFIIYKMNIYIPQNLFIFLVLVFHLVVIFPLCFCCPGFNFESFSLFHYMHSLSVCLSVCLLCIKHQLTYCLSLSLSPSILLSSSISVSLSFPLIFLSFVRLFPFPSSLSLGLPDSLQQWRIMCPTQNKRAGSASVWWPRLHTCTPGLTSSSNWWPLLSFLFAILFIWQPRCQLCHVAVMPDSSAKSVLSSSRTFVTAPPTCCLSTALHDLKASCLTHGLSLSE